MPDSTRNPILDHLAPLAGEWTTEATHRLMPGTVIRGTATFEWLEGGRFMIWRAHSDNPDIPSAVSIMGCEPEVSENAGESGGGCIQHYCDSRGVTRNFELDAERGVWRTSREWPGFSQRFTCTISADGDTMQGLAELCEDGTTWVEDLWVTYTRTAAKPAEDVSPRTR